MSVQGSEEWFADRLGCCTVSCFGKVLSKGVGKAESLTRTDYIYDVATERITGKRNEDTYESPEMRWGKEQEPYAREAYEERNHVLVRQVGFVKHPTIPWLGGSPDGLVIGQRGGNEIKCPKTKTHAATLRRGMDPKHTPQVQGTIWINDLDWVDFISFDPRLPSEIQLYVQRVMRDDEYILKLEREVRQFLREVEEEVEWMREKIDNAPLVGW